MWLVFANDYASLAQPTTTGSGMVATRNPTAPLSVPRGVEGTILVRKLVRVVEPHDRRARPSVEQQRRPKGNKTGNIDPDSDFEGAEEKSQSLLGQRLL